MLLEDLEIKTRLVVGMDDAARHLPVELSPNFFDALQEEILQLRASCGSLKCSFGLFDLKVVFIPEFIVLGIFLVHQGLDYC